MRHISANTGHTIPLGRRGENLATEVAFDVSAWLKDYPAGEIRLIAQRKGDAYPYPVVTSRQGSTLYWVVSAADSGVEGFGACELQLWEGEMLMKSRPFTTYTATALEDPDKVPDVLEPYYQRLDELIAEAEAAAAAGVVPEAVWLKGHAEGTEVDIYDGADDKPLVQLRITFWPNQSKQPVTTEPVAIIGHTDAPLTVREINNDSGEETVQRLPIDFLPAGGGAAVSCYAGYVDVVTGMLHSTGELFSPTEADSVEEYSSHFKVARFAIPEVPDSQHLLCNKAVNLTHEPTATDLSAPARAYCRVDPDAPGELLLYFGPLLTLDGLLEGIEFFLPTEAEQVIQIDAQDIRTHAGRELLISSDFTMNVTWRRDLSAYLRAMNPDDIWYEIAAADYGARQAAFRLVSRYEETDQASRDYEEGELLVVVDTLVKANSHITAGTQLVFGNNVTETTLAAELAALQGQGTAVTVDDALSAESENPVQNKVLKAALDGKGTYSKPSGGIPKTDLDAAVQISLGKADTALQEHQSLNGYATQQWVGQQSYLTAHQDISGKLNIAQGSSNAGKFLVVGADGNITLVTMTAWQGGNY